MVRLSGRLGCCEILSPEALQVMIPEDGVFALNREQIDDAFGNRQIVCFGHHHFARLVCAFKSVIIPTSTDIKSGRIGAHSRRGVNGHKAACNDHKLLKTLDLSYYSAFKRTCVVEAGFRPNI